MKCAINTALQQTDYKPRIRQVSVGGNSKNHEGAAADAGYPFFKSLPI